MGKKIRLLWGGALGATLQYLYDPQSGKSRRARLKDQAAARARDATRLIGRKIRYQKGRLRGAAHEMAAEFRVREGQSARDVQSVGKEPVLRDLRSSGTSRFH